ncbi:diacylglycerol kinase family protein [Zoogloea sp.]|uniref:diacylglycerol/lipid kinase family protein n=1 Tax=Zoogloea sp. TaxID=49181 RepID=UPI0035B18DBE
MGQADAPRLDAVPPWLVVVNAASGRQEGDAIAALIRDTVSARGHQVSVRLINHAAELEQTARQAARQARDRNGLLVAVGGDGTLNAVAAAALEAGAAFSVIPGGTFNYFGRSNGFPTDPEAAIHAVLRGRLRPIQVGRVNERIFLVNASLGLYPQLLEDREAFKRQWGRSRPVAWGAALLTLLGRHRLHRLHLQSGDVDEHLLASTLFVGNNRLQLSHIGLPEAGEVDAGQLVGLVLRPVGRLGLVRLALQGVLGRLADADEVERRVFRRLWVAPGRWWRRRQVRIAVDGEQLRMRTPLVFEVAPRPLWLVAPDPPQDEASG